MKKLIFLCIIAVLTGCCSPEPINMYGEYSITVFEDSIMIHEWDRVLAKLPSSEFGKLDSIITADNQ